MGRDESFHYIEDPQDCCSQSQTAEPWSCLLCLVALMVDDGFLMVESAVSCLPLLHPQLPQFHHWVHLKVKLTVSIFIFSGLSLSWYLTDGESGGKVVCYVQQMLSLVLPSKIAFIFCTRSMSTCNNGVNTAAQKELFFGQWMFHNHYTN